MTSRDGRAIARENEIRTLRALHRFGWLRTRDLAALVWQQWMTLASTEPSLKPQEPTASAMRMAQRTLRRLTEKRQVLSARAPDGAVIYALAEAGARVLQQIGVPALTGKDLIRTFSSGHYRHRCIANAISVSCIVQGFRVATEREISQGLWLGGEAGIAGKRPDVLVRSGDKFWWVEVERSRKNAKDYAHLLTWLGKVMRDALNPSETTLLGERLRWARILFVCTPAFKAKLYRDLQALGWKKNQIEAVIFFDFELYDFKDIAFS